MSFFSGWLAGFFIGMVLVVAFARFEQIRNSRRADLAKMVAAFARMTVQDSRKLLPREYYPSWVVFSQWEKLNWLNNQLDKIWPYINEAASDLIRMNVEPILEQYTPSLLSSLKFGTLSLGTIAPQFTGIMILEEECEDGGVTMELEVQWDGDPDIVLDINTRFGVSLPIQVKDIGFTGIFRLIFKPLVNEFPGFAAVSYSLREKKKLDFTLKVIGGDVSAIPGVSEAIEETIKDAIEDAITWPVRKIVSILPGDYSDLELKPAGILDVKLVQAKDLTNKDIIGKSDPFAQLFVRPLRNRMKTSKTINNQLNPIWNENFDFLVEDESTQNLTVKIYDDEGVQGSEPLGCAQVPLKTLQPGKVKEVWLTLVKDVLIQKDTKYRGQVHLELLYCPFGLESSFKNPFNPDFSLTSLEKALKGGGGGDGEAELEKKQRKDVFVRGVLSVTVVAAEDLPSADFMGKADPYVVLTMKKCETKAKTRVVNESLNPVWNQTFDFVVEDALHEMLILEVYDHDTFKKDKIGRCIMTLTRALLETEFQHSFVIDGAKSGKLLLRLKWASQFVFRDS